MRSTEISEIFAWMNQLNILSVSGSCGAPNFLKPFHFVTLALAVKRIECGGLVLPDEIAGYAARMGLWKASGLPAYDGPRKDPAGRFHPVMPLRSSTDGTIAAKNLAQVMTRNCSDCATDSVLTILCELTENCVRHASPDDDLYGLVCGQVWVNGRRAQLAIADPGIGIRRSLAENPELHDRLTSANACALATEYGVTSKPGVGHRGLGLNLARKVLEYNDGRLLILSHDEAICCTSANILSYSAGPSWDGTLVVVEWRTDRPLSVKDVYSSWPTEGVSDDDFDF